MPLVLSTPARLNDAARRSRGDNRIEPLLSVGMPVYNGAAWISESVDSVLGQGFKDFELIITDNASTDGTEDICRNIAHRDGRVRYYRNETNIGVFRNYDRVFELASGKYFKWASCSDVCGDGFFDRCVSVLERRPDVVLAYPQTVLVSSRTRTHALYHDGLTLEDARPSQRYARFLNRVHLNNAMNGVIRSDALRRTALNRPLPGSDISMLAELALYGKFVEVPERLFFRRVDPETTGILMDGSTASDRVAAYRVQPSLRSRVSLHLHRFIRVARAPIGTYERLCVWSYLVRRLLWLRHGLLRRLARLGRGR